MTTNKLHFWLSQLNWKLVVITMAVFAGLIKLGLWQSERAVEKEQRLARIAQLQQAKPLSLTEVLRLADSGENINDIPVSIEASFNHEYQFLLDNQTNAGRLGYRVFQIVQTNGYALLVNLGWVQGFVERDKLPDITAIEGLKSFKGNVRVVEKGITLAEQNYQQVTWPLRVQQIELSKFSHIVGQKLLPFVVYLDKKEPIGFVKNWQPIVMPPEKHRGYAFQWFSLAAAWLMLMISASIFWARQNNNNKV